MKKSQARWSFLRELKRRRVLHTASLYVLIGFSFGFPLALVAGWFFDISAEGIEKTGALKQDEQLPKLKEALIYS